MVGITAKLSLKEVIVAPLLFVGLTVTEHERIVIIIDTLLKDVCV